jgi:hypothetical protein
MGGLVEADTTVLIHTEHAVDDTDVEVEVGVEGRPEPVQERDGADLGSRAGSGTGASERGANGSNEDAQRGTGDGRIVVEEGANPLRDRQHPPTDGQRGQDVVGEMGGGLHHATPVARRTHAPALAAERHQELAAAAGAAGAPEAVGKDAAPQVGPELALDPSGNAGAGGITPCGLRQERLEVVLKTPAALECLQGTAEPTQWFCRWSSPPPTPAGTPPLRSP